MRIEADVFEAYSGAVIDLLTFAAEQIGKLQSDNKDLGSSNVAMIIQCLTMARSLAPKTSGPPKNGPVSTTSNAFSQTDENEMREMGVGTDDSEGDATVTEDSMVSIPKDTYERVFAKLLEALVPDEEAYNELFLKISFDNGTKISLMAIAEVYESALQKIMNHDEELKQLLSVGTLKESQLNARIEKMKEFLLAKDKELVSSFDESHRLKIENAVIGKDKDALKKSLQEAVAKQTDLLSKITKIEDENQQMKKKIEDELKNKKEKEKEDQGLDEEEEEIEVINQGEEGSRAESAKDELIRLKKQAEVGKKIIENLSKKLKELPGQIKTQRKKEYGSIIENLLAHNIWSEDQVKEYNAAQDDITNDLDPEHRLKSAMDIIFKLEKTRQEVFNDNQTRGKIKLDELTTLIEMHKERYDRLYEDATRMNEERKRFQQEVVYGQEKLRKTEAIVGEYEAHVKTLDTQAEQMHNQNKALFTSLNQRTSDLKASIEEVTQLKIELKLSRETSLHYSKLAEDYLKKVIELKNQIIVEGNDQVRKELKIKLDQAELDLKKSKETIDKNKKLIIERETKLNSMMRDFDTLKDELITYIEKKSNKKLPQARRAILNVSDIFDFITAYIDESEKATEGVRDAYKDLKEQNTKDLATMSELRKQIFAYGQEVANYQGIIRRIEAEKIQLNARLEAKIEENEVNKRAYVAKIQGFMRTIEYQKKQIGSLQYANEEQIKSIADLEKRLAHAQREASLFSEKILTQEERIARLTTALKNMRDKQKDIRFTAKTEIDRITAKIGTYHDNVNKIADSYGIWMEENPYDFSHEQIEQYTNMAKFLFTTISGYVFVITMAYQADVFSRQIENDMTEFYKDIETCLFSQLEIIKTTANMNMEKIDDWITKIREFDGNHCFTLEDHETKEIKIYTMLKLISYIRNDPIVESLVMAGIHANQEVDKQFAYYHQLLVQISESENGKKFVKDLTQKIYSSVQSIAEVQNDLEGRRADVMQDFMEGRTGGSEGDQMNDRRTVFGAKIVHHLKDMLLYITRNITIEFRKSGIFLTFPESRQDVETVEALNQLVTVNMGKITEVTSKFQIIIATLEEKVFEVKQTFINFQKELLQQASTAILMLASSISTLAPAIRTQKIVYATNSVSDLTMSLLNYGNLTMVSWKRVMEFYGLNEEFIGTKHNDTYIDLNDTQFTEAIQNTKTYAQILSISSASMEFSRQAQRYFQMLIEISEQEQQLTDISGIPAQKFMDNASNIIKGAMSIVNATQAELDATKPGISGERKAKEFVMDEETASTLESLSVEELTVLVIKNIEQMKKSPVLEALMRIEAKKIRMRDRAKTKSFKVIEQLPQEMASKYMNVFSDIVAESVIQRRIQEEYQSAQERSERMEPVPVIGLRRAIDEDIEVPLERTYKASKKNRVTTQRELPGVQITPQEALEFEGVPEVEMEQRPLSKPKSLVFGRTNKTFRSERTETERRRKK
jgi:hypothetical protein